MPSVGLARLPYLMLAVTLVCLPAGARAQAKPASGDQTDGSLSAAATTNDEGPAGIVPYVKGYNLSLATTSQHDSSNGWSSFLSPDVAYRFNEHFSADATTPLYVYINVDANTGTKKVPVYVLETKHLVAGDTAINGHYETSFPLIDYNLTTTLGAPTGNTRFGLGAGQVTYLVNNHFEKDFTLFSPDLELGIGDSSSLLDPRVRKSYTSVGELAHFQVGSGIALPHDIGFEADAYEDLPLSSQTLNSTTGKGRRKVTTSTTKAVGEDNGFLTSLDIPLGGHTTLSGFYNRSLRNHIDTAGFTFTFLLKAPPVNVVR